MADSSSKCNNASSRPATRCQEPCHGKVGNVLCFPPFPWHGYGYLYGSIHGICCTWNLNVPCPIHATILSHEWDTTNPNRRAFLFLIPVPCSIAPALRSLHKTPSNDPIAICPCGSSTCAFPSLTTSRVSIPASRAGSSSRTTSEKKQTPRGSTCSTAAIAL